jgi:hypothetical protein
MEDPKCTSSIDRDQAILLASRLFAAFLLFWVVDDITELPRELFSVMHYLRLSTGAGVGVYEAFRISYLFGEEMMYLVGNILRIALWLLAAGWFYRCGPRIRRFFESDTQSL